MAEAERAAVVDHELVTVVLTPILAVAHAAYGCWLSFILFGLAGGIETHGRLTRYGGIEYAWTSLAWWPGGLLVPAGGGLAGLGALLMLAGSGAAGYAAASAAGRLCLGPAPRLGRRWWRLWVPAALWLVWLPVPAEGTVTYWHTVAY